MGSRVAVAASDGVLDRRPLYDESTELLFCRLGKWVWCKYTYFTLQKVAKWREMRNLFRAHLHTIGAEGLLLRDGEERLVQLRRSHRRSRLGGKRKGKRPPFKL